MSPTMFEKQTPAMGHFVFPERLAIAGLAMVLLITVGIAAWTVWLFATHGLIWMFGISATIAGALVFAGGLAGNLALRRASARQRETWNRVLGDAEFLCEALAAVATITVPDARGDARREALRQRDQVLADRLVENIGGLRRVLVELADDSETKWTADEVLARWQARQPKD